MKILMINGANLNLLGIREPEKYGRETLSEIEEMLMKYANEKGFLLDVFQSNIEGEIVNKIHQSRGVYSGIVINAGGYSHTSIVIADALAGVRLPTVEVHMTNISARESFRHNSLLTPVCKGMISGFGSLSYKLALDALFEICSKK